MIVDNGKCAVLVLLDLSFAFDTVDHCFMIQTSDSKTIGCLVIFSLLESSFVSSVMSFRIFE